MSLPKFPDRKPTWVIPYDDRIKELEQQLAEREKQIVMLREAAKLAHTALEDWLVCDLDEDQCEFATKKVNEALAATQDLSGLVLCDAVHVGHGLFDADGKCYAIGKHPSSLSIGRKAFKSEPLYKASKP